MIEDTPYFSEGHIVRKDTDNQAARLYFTYKDMPWRIEKINRERGTLKLQGLEPRFSITFFQRDRDSKFAHADRVVCNEASSSLTQGDIYTVRNYKPYTEDEGGKVQLKETGHWYADWRFERPEEPVEAEDATEESDSLGDKLRRRRKDYQESDEAHPHDKAAYAAGIPHEQHTHADDKTVEEFLPGQHVVCEDAYGYATLVEGRIYVVEEAFIDAEGAPTLHVRGDDGQVNQYLYADRFQPLLDDEDEPVFEEDFDPELSEGEIEQACIKEDRIRRAWNDVKGDVSQVYDLRGLSEIMKRFWEAVEDIRGETTYAEEIESVLPADVFSDIQASRKTWIDGYNESLSRDETWVDDEPGENESLNEVIDDIEERIKAQQSVSDGSEDDATSPRHYDIFGGQYQVLHLMADRLGDGFAPYLEGNVMKYLLRWRHKNGVEDLKKALRYLSWLVEFLDDDFDMDEFHESRKWED